MDDPLAEHAYIARRLGEVRTILIEGAEVEAELTRALSNGTASLPMNRMRWAEFIESRRTRLEHIEVELFVLAYRAPPMVFLLVREPVVLPWWRGLWWW